MLRKSLSRMVVVGTMRLVNETLSHAPFLGGNLNAASRQALMQKLARTAEPSLVLPEM